MAQAQRTHSQYQQKARLAGRASSTTRTLLEARIPKELPGPVSGTILHGRR